MTTSPLPSQPLDRRRFRRVLAFFLRVFVSILFWDFLLNRPLLRVLRPRPERRWRRIARRYRKLAVEMGGVLIKLGQYLSTRVDVLPHEITGELSGLQDEVPAEPFAAILERLEASFPQPIDEVFLWIDPKPLGAASLAQVHGARLPEGDEVVIKILRPGIEERVETDLAAVSVAVRWLKRWKFIRRRVDLEWLIDEFATTTRAELDLTAEGRNAEAFAKLFSRRRVTVPRVYWQATGRTCLTQQNVKYLKIDDLEALEQAGIAPSKVARKLYRLYMEQIFLHNLVHADPHPGNLFVQPMPLAADPVDASYGPGDAVPPAPDGTERSFRLVFVDFGMMATIPERLRNALRDFLLGLAERDAYRVVQALRAAGVLLPGADLAQLEDAVDLLFEKLWGVDMGRLNDVARAEFGNLWSEMGELLLETPVQAQVDLMFTTRALEILTGLATRLDPNFNPWEETVPFARRLAAREARRASGDLVTELVEQSGRLLTLPTDLARFLTDADRGKLTLRSTLAPDHRRQLKAIEKAIRRLGATLFAAALLVAGAVVYHAGEVQGGTGLMAAAALPLVWGWWRWR